jgi:uncharacterized protein (DUF779 family)
VISERRSAISDSSWATASRTTAVAGAPFYIDAEQYQRWGEPEFLLDVSSAAPEGFSLGEPDGHFVSTPLSGWGCESSVA